MIDSLRSAKLEGLQQRGQWGPKQTRAERKIIQSKSKGHSNYGNKGIKFIAGYGNGKLRFCVKVNKVVSDAQKARMVKDGVKNKAKLKGNFNNETYDNVVTSKIAPAIRAMQEENNGAICYLVRDNQTAYNGKAEENEKLNVIKLPSKRPSLMPLDFTFHNAIINKLTNEGVKKKIKKETLQQYQKRIQRNYNLKESTVRGACRSMRKRIRALAVSKGKPTIYDNR